ncbi:neutral and basic amino acid transport protein rBAT [Nasonia vitripennis]|uniref:Glycosyl hydrolase family 13 catalytic domain-containing protein n=1 Tax=Nasonia vitripennis TaxID=7425 RepID=A0A7M7QSC3_NASVI|nr:neutral and basic amino acid transport protein rBAT [Nasonia vitripennis]XP_008217715.1 neutral and basic amino acid transport protein rBAT [Nasonia vitripennis]XP_016837856.1 neutral and basic amino acid transport protein rBAT [Nasonia vitripennis]XP_032452962.1 neutral and basic amino acid transport protein rBAT [Nasonia vitripennis]
MSIPKPDGRLSVVIANEILTSPSSQRLIHRDQQDEETSDCPLLTPSPPPEPSSNNPLDGGGGGVIATGFKPHGEPPTTLDQTLCNNINSEDGLAFLNIVNSSCKQLNDEPSSRDPMVETSSNSGSSSDTNEPVCTQLLTQLNTAYNHLAPDAQALFYNQDNGGKPPLTGIQLVVPKPPKNYGFMSWNWPVIRKVCFWSLMSLFTGCIAIAIGIIATMPKKCDPRVEWWQGSLFYEIFPASFQDSYNNDGIGDFRGITKRLDYLQNLGVKGIRLNSIFRSQQYPQHYMDIESLTEADPILGDTADFTKMVSAIHQRNMTLILDLLLFPFVKDFGGSANLSSNDQFVRHKRNEAIAATDLPSRSETMESLLSAPVNPSVDVSSSTVRPTVPSFLEEHPVTKSIRHWSDLGVDGFYLKGLEHYTNEKNFVGALRLWKTILGSKRIMMCSENALLNVPDDVRDVILGRMDLVDVTLDVVNGTKKIMDEVSETLKGLLFQEAGYPWIHWSTGSVDKPRLASTLKVANASVAIAMMGMMLPGTPSIFYGDEIGMLNSESKEHQDLNHLYQLVPMRWDNQNSNDETFSKPTAAPWMPESAKPAATNLTGLLPEMSKLRNETMPIHIKVVIKNKVSTANGKVRYTMDDMIVIERWYPRRNTYVFVANLGMHSQTKDLSSLYYGGHVVVGPEHKLNRNIYFKELTIPPGEAFVIKLDK